MGSMPHGSWVRDRKGEDRTVAEDVFLDLKRLSERTCVSVSSLRDSINDPSHPLPAYRVKGKSFVSWLEFTEWIQKFRRQTVDLDAIVNSVMEDLLRKK
jgi:hypothetical protein